MCTTVPWDNDSYLYNISANVFLIWFIVRQMLCASVNTTESRLCLYSLSVASLHL